MHETLVQRFRQWTGPRCARIGPSGSAAKWTFASAAERPVQVSAPTSASDPLRTLPSAISPAVERLAALSASYSYGISADLMKDSERFTQQAMDMSRKAASAPTAQEREGYLALAGAYAKMASDAAYFEARFGGASKGDELD